MVEHLIIVAAVHRMLRGEGHRNGALVHFELRPVEREKPFEFYNQIAVDVGTLFDMGRRIDVFGGVQFWYNKFGYPVSARYGGGGAMELTPYLGVGVHF